MPSLFYRKIRAPCTLSLKEMHDVIKQVLSENDLSIAKEISSSPNILLFYF